MPEPHETPSERLSSRMRLERFTFLAFAAVLSVMALAGVVEFKRNQTELLDRCARVNELVGMAGKAKRDHDADLEKAEKENDRLEGELARAHEGERKAAVNLGLALTRLALADADGDDATRAQAREVLADIPREDAPPFMPLARWALADAHSLAQVYSGGTSNLPIDVAAISRDCEAFAAARHDRGVDVFVTLDGRRAYIEPHEPADSVQSLALANSFEVFTGGKQGTLTYYRISLDHSMVASSHAVARFPQTVRALGLSPSGGRIAAADTSGTLQVFEVAPPHTVLMETRLSSTALATCALDDDEYRALALCADGKLVLLKGNRGDLLQVHAFDAAPDCWAIGTWGGRVLAACAYGDKLERIVAENGKVTRQATIAHGLGSVCYLAFGADGTLFAAARSGQASRILDDDSVARLPLDFGKPLRLAAICRHGYLLVGASGQITLSPDLDLIRQGIPTAVRTAKTRAEATPLGFTLTAEDGGTFFWAGGQRVWRYSGQAERVLPLWTTYATSTGNQGRGPAGQIVPDAGILVAAVQSPQTAIFVRDNELVCVRELGAMTTAAAPVTGLPDGAASAPGPGGAVLLRYDRRLFKLHTSGQLDEVDGDAAAGPIALSADGSRAAFFNGRGMQVAGDLPPTQIMMRKPTATGLMFGGTVLACLDAGVISFYELATGHCLHKLATEAVSFAARDSELLLITPTELRVLTFTE